MDLIGVERHYLEDRLRELIDGRLDQLFALWKTLGLRDIRRQRTDDVLKHVGRCLSDMVSEDEENVEKTKKRITNLTLARTNLRADLSLPEETGTALELEGKPRILSM